MTADQIITKLLDNRGLTTDQAVREFFHPPHPKSLPAPFVSEEAIQLIKQHIESHSKIFIYGDYDVDGICSTALLWEALYAVYPQVFPHIPHRREEGYGLSVKGIDHCLAQGANLIIAVDNGIVAFDQVDYCRNHGCDIIIIDHHELAQSLPHANVVLHSTSTCAAGLTWFFCRDFAHSDPALDLVCLAVICDLVPLMGTNRSFAKYGLVDLRTTSRPGLLALFETASLLPESLTPYHVGFIIGPRLNAMGRLEHALDSLRLLCTHDPVRARELAVLLNDTNKNRQDLTQSAVDYALSHLSLDSQLLVSAHESYDEGVIGLVAAKLVEKYHRPSIAISIGPGQSKGSARSIPGFDITSHLRSYSHLMTNVGGHAMAAGFTLDSSNISDLISNISHPDISPDLLVKSQRVDCEIELSDISLDLYLRLQDFAPFGLGNPQPVFFTRGVTVTHPRAIGKLNQHLKFNVDGFDAVYFNPPFPDSGEGLEVRYKEGDKFDLFYSLDSNTWNNQTKLQLLVKDLTPLLNP